MRKDRSIPVNQLSRPCPYGPSKMVKGGARWEEVRDAVADEPGGPRIFRLCGDVKALNVDGAEEKSK